jgi:hypothetical protein
VSACENLLLGVARRIAILRIRAETTSMHITIATISKITVAASPSLNDRMVSQR